MLTWKDVLNFFNKKKKHKIVYEFNRTEKKDDEVGAVLATYVESLGMINYDKFDWDSYNWNPNTRVITLWVTEKDDDPPPDKKVDEKVEDFKPMRAS